jgi:ribonuclease HII
MLLPSYSGHLIEAGCDEAGRGCLAGPVFAAAVILPADFSADLIDDSKKLSAAQRLEARKIIQDSALAWAVEMVGNQVIDEINILNASILAMHKALDSLTVKPQLILVDGNRFHAYHDIPFRCVVKGDAEFQSIAAASILAKTYRDEFMEQLDRSFPNYGWRTNKGYPTEIHRKAIFINGLTPYHRKSFRTGIQMKLFNAG